MSTEYLPCRVSLEIEYVNSKNEASKRIIDVRTFATDTAGSVKAFCHLRRTLRSFKYANIQYCVDVLTGEVIAPERLLTYFNEVYQSDPARELDAFLSEHKPIIDLFTYMMQVDGRISASERAVILQWVFAQSFLSEQFLNYCDAVIKNWTPPATEREYLMTLQYANRLFPEYTQDIYTQARAIMLADKKQHENELIALEQMRRVFGVEV